MTISICSHDAQGAEASKAYVSFVDILTDKTSYLWTTLSPWIS